MELSLDFIGEDFFSLCDSLDVRDVSLVGLKAKSILVRRKYFGLITDTHLDKLFGLE